MIARVLFGFVVVAAATAVVQPLPAEALSRRVEWRPVRGSSGYLIQIRDAREATLFEREVEDHAAEVRLERGEYRLRVASLNKFGQPAAWSAWKSLRVRGQEREVRLDESTVELPATSGSAVAVARLEEPPTDYGSPLKILVPGWTQFQTGHPLRGAAYLGAFAGLVFAGGQAYTAGNTYAAQAEARTSLFFLGPLAGQPLLTLYAYTDRAGLRSAYDGAQATQQNIGLLSIVLYLVQIGDALWLRSAPSALSDASTPRRPFEVHFDAISDARNPGARVEFLLRW